MQQFQPKQAPYRMTLDTWEKRGELGSLAVAEPGFSGDR